MSSTIGAASGTQPPEAKPIIVLFDPKWNFELEHFDVNRFFDEAKVTENSIEVLQSRFDKFCSVGKDSAFPTHLTPEDFQRMNEHYSICKPHEEGHFFRSMDRSGGQRLSFQDFLLGYAAELAQDLGDVSVVTLRVSGLSGPLCDVRASTRWTGLKVRKEIARQLQVPVEGQELLLGERHLKEDHVLETFFFPGTTSSNITLVRTNWDQWPCTPEPSASDGVVGLERLVHVTFQSFYEALVSEQLRGTSRLFRFHRSILHTKKGAIGGA